MFSALFGTLKRTLTSDLPLRRRPLYTTELLGHIYPSIVPKKAGSVNRPMEKEKSFLSQNPTSFSSSATYTVITCFRKEERNMGSGNQPVEDLDDWLFGDEDWLPSDR